MTKRCENLKERVENLAFQTPKEDENSVRNYLFLAEKAHGLLKKIVYAKQLEMLDDIELDWLEAEVEKLEADLKKVIKEKD